jgi:hypothetical protein
VADTRRILPWDPLLLLAVNAVVYSPVVLFGYFVSDDFNLRALQDPAGGVNWRILQDVLTCVSAEGYFYRPLPLISVTLDYVFWRANPAGYFLTNQVLHGLISVCVWGTARELGWSRGAAIVSGLATILHPLHVEALWWVAGRFDLLAGLLSALTLWAYVRWLGRGGGVMAACVVVGYTLAIFSKEAAVALPLVLAATLAVSAPSWSSVHRHKHVGLFVSLLLAGAGLFLARRLCLGVWVGRYPSGLSPANPLAIVEGIPRFLLLMLYPAPLPSSPGTSPIVVIAAVMSAVLLLGALIVRGTGRHARWAGAVTLLLALPVLALVGVLQRPEDHGRILLLPAIGFGLLVGSVFASLRGPLARLHIGVILVAWVVLLAQYQQPWVARAGRTRALLAQIEWEARTPGVSQVAIVGLPEFFGQGNWALPAAASRPFIDVPSHVRVTVAAEPPDAADRSIRVLVWNPQRGSLEARGVP